jgi:hypothetical protein
MNFSCSNVNKPDLPQISSCFSNHLFSVLSSSGRRVHDSLSIDQPWLSSVQELLGCTHFISLFSIPATLFPLDTCQSRLTHRQSRLSCLDIDIFLIIEPTSFLMNPYSCPASVRGCRCSFLRPLPTFEYLFSVPHSHPVSLLVSIEQLVLTHRANPLLPLTRQLACRHQRPLRHAPPRRYLSRQENKGKWAQHVQVHARSDRTAPCTPHVWR